MCKENKNQQKNNEKMKTKVAATVEAWKKKRTQSRLKAKFASIAIIFYSATTPKWTRHLNLMSMYNLAEQFVSLLHLFIFHLLFLFFSLIFFSFLTCDWWHRIFIACTKLLQGAHFIFGAHILKQVLKCLEIEI